MLVTDCAPPIGCSREPVLDGEHRGVRVYLPSLGGDARYVVAWSSVSPTGGCASPALTTVTLATRLAHRLRGD